MRTPRIAALVLASAAAIGTGIAVAPANATPQDDTAVVVKLSGFSGSGCPRGSADAPESDWKGSQIVRFTDFVAKQGKGAGITEGNKNCRLQFNFRSNKEKYTGIRVSSQLLFQLFEGAEGRVRQVVSLPGGGSSVGQWKKLTSADSDAGQGELVDNIPLRGSVPASSNVVVNIEAQFTRPGTDRTVQSQIQVASVDVGIAN